MMARRSSFAYAERLAELTAENATLRERVAALTEDAERLAWLVHHQLTGVEDAREILAAHRALMEDA